MPELPQRTIERTGPGNINAPTWKISAVVTQNGNVISDLTGDNAVRFPACLGLLPQADQDEIVDMVANAVIYKLAALQGGGA